MCLQAADTFQWRVSGPARHSRAMSIPSTAERLAAYRAAELAVLQGQSVRMDLSGAGSQLWQGADLAAIQAGIQQLERKLASEQAAASGAPRIGGLGFARARMD